MANIPTTCFSIFPFMARTAADTLIKELPSGASGNNGGNSVSTAGRTSFTIESILGSGKASPTHSESSNSPGIPTGKAGGVGNNLQKNGNNNPSPLHGNGGSAGSLASFQPFHFMHHPAFHLHNPQAAAELFGKYCSLNPYKFS